MSHKTDTESADQPTSWLIYQWVIAGIVSSYTRFIPIPFLDEFIQTQCRRFTVATTLSAHESAIESSGLQPYFGSSGGCLSGCLGALVKAPLKLLFFPFRKVLSVITSIRDVPLEIMRMVLLGRTLDRYLCDGKLVDNGNAAATIVSGRATQMRLAFDRSFTRMDIHVIRAAMKDALTGVSSLKTAALASFKGILYGNSRALEKVQSDPTVEAEANRVQEVLDRPDMLAVFLEFDQRFDEFMANLA